MTNTEILKLYNEEFELANKIILSEPIQVYLCKNLSEGMGEATICMIVEEFCKKRGLNASEMFNRMAKVNKEVTEYSGTY